MPFIELQQRLYPLRVGENRVGASVDCDVRIPNFLPDEQLAITVERPGSFIWTEGGRGGAEINGRPLSDDPMPLFSGDQIALRGTTLVYLDDRGPAGGLAAQPAVKDLRKEEKGVPMVNQGDGQPELVGVLCRLDDGQKFVIDESGFSIGREKKCNIVIPDGAVSRLNTEISYSNGAYTLRDVGRTGTKVNGREIMDTHPLQVGDVIQIGGYEFSFMRRPASAADLVPPDEATPVRSDVPEAATVEFARAGEANPQGGSRVFFWLLVIVASGAAAFLLITS